MSKIFILEDDKNISSIIEFNLRAKGYDTVCEYDGEKGLLRIISEGCDLVILDLMLPSLDGFEVLKKLREKSNLPVIILSARTDERDKLEGLSLMADDYITKPFSVAELCARVKVVLARCGNDKKACDIVLDNESLTVICRGSAVCVSKKEFQILRYLFDNRGRVVSREEIMKKVWGYDGYLGDLRAVDVAMARLRAKIEKNPSEPQIILSRRGAGYYTV